MKKAETFVLLSGSLEAFEFDGDMMDSTGKWYVPEWAVIALHKEQLKYKDAGELYCYLPDGRSVHVQAGDYIARNHKGTIFPIPKYVADNMYIPQMKEE